MRQREREAMTATAGVSATSSSLLSWEVTKLQGHHTHLYRFHSFLFSCSVELPTCPGLPWPRPPNRPVACPPFPSVHTPNTSHVHLPHEPISITAATCWSHAGNAMLLSRGNKRSSCNVSAFSTWGRKWKCDLILISPHYRSLATDFLYVWKLMKDSYRSLP